MKLPRLITRRRLKWAGLVATACLAAAMVASHWYWPSYHRFLKPPSIHWEVEVVPGGIKFSREWFWMSQATVNVSTFEFDSRKSLKGRTSGYRTGWWPIPDLYAWLPSYQKAGKQPEISRWLVIPFWMPLVLCALPTAYFFWPARKRKPWQCARCRYDLRGLDGGGNGVCPECGTPTQRKP